MLDASSYTASPADQDIIYIQPELPFMLIGASGRSVCVWVRGGGGLGETNRVKETRGGVMRGKKEQLVHVGERQSLVSEGKSKVSTGRYRRGGIRGKSRVEKKQNFVPLRSTVDTPT